jgi:hypothetical protein
MKKRRKFQSKCHTREILILYENNYFSSVRMKALNYKCANLNSALLKINEITQDRDNVLMRFLQTTVKSVIKACRYKSRPSESLEMKKVFA